MGCLVLGWWIVCLVGWLFGGLVVWWVGILVGWYFGGLVCKLFGM
jgi:hypothetical protein